MTRFSQLLNHLLKASVKRIIDSSNSDRYVKTLKTYDLLVLMLFGQVSQAHSLRRLIDGFASHDNHITLKSKPFEWAQHNATHRTQGLRLQVVVQD